MVVFSVQQEGGRIRSLRVAIAALSMLVLCPGAALAQDRTAGAATRREYLQYGFALAAEALVSPGNVCPAGSANPCILGGGGGVGLRLGYRAKTPFYFGGAYEFSRHYSSNLLRLAILQQFRAEGRYYFDQGERVTGFLTAAAGLHLYGNEWAASTGGGLAAAGAGIEIELSATTTLGCMALYRVLLPRAWTDTTGVRRADGLFGFGVAHLVGLEVALEVRDQLPRF